MKIALAANYDPELIPQLPPGIVTEIYGKFPADVVGGGRPSYMGTPMSRRDLADYVALLDRHGITFNYLLNSACTGNREWGRRWHKRLTRLIERLGKMGVRRLTVSTPYLMELVKRRFPSMEVKAGIFAQIDTPNRARFWEELGADGMTVESFSINRDFGRLRSIRTAVSCELQLIPNHCCLPNCPLQVYHQNGFAHSSDGSGRLFIDYCALNCTWRRMRQPSLMVKSAWIRPEDIHAYESMGYETFKLLERGIPSRELLKRVRAYAARRFEGNLCELIVPYGFEEPRKRNWTWLLAFLKPRQVNPLRMRPLLELIRHQGMLFPRETAPVVLDNAAIPPDFIDEIQRRDCGRLDCDACGYCERVAGTALRIDESFREESLRRFGEVRELLVGGGLWHV